MNRWILAFLIMVAASPGWAKPTQSGPSYTSSSYSVTWKFDTTTEPTPLMGAKGLCVATFIRAGSETVTLYQTTASTATGGTSVASFSATTTSPTNLTYGQPSLYAVSDGATAGGSLTIHCSPLQVTGTGGGGADVTSSDYEPGDNVSSIIATISDPSITQMGYGITFGDPATFAADPDGEADNLMGPFYNKLGVGGSLINQYEHAFDDSWEMSYRATSGTGDHTWIERNVDIFPPDNSSTLTSINGSFDPAVGETVFFSGGGTGKVISWSSPTLVWRQDFGATAAGETVIDDDGNPAHTAVVGTPTSLATTNRFRTFQYEHDTLNNQSEWRWYSLSGDQTGAPHYEQDDLGPAFAVGSANLNGRKKVAVGINDSIGSNATFTVQDSALWNNPLMLLKYRSNGLTNLDAAVGTDDGWGANGSFVGMRIDIDYSATNTEFQSPLLLYVPAPTVPGSGTTMVRPTVMRVDSQGGYGATGGPIFNIMPQTCGTGADECAANPGSYGNFLFGGGNWNNGHLSFIAATPGYDENADHLWRDETNEVFRVSTDDAPDSETDGRPIVTGTNSTAHGVTMWGISDASGAAVFDTGTEICATAGVGLTCQDVIEFSTVGTPTDSDCATAHANAVKFMAMCY